MAVYIVFDVETPNRANLNVMCDHYRIALDHHSTLLLFNLRPSESRI